ncbi:unnamed protein product [Closterium sp. Yama58-4]|nr:unnamed protein product [Closterium sp. Yama58-4]
MGRDRVDMVEHHSYDQDGGMQRMDGQVSKDNTHAKEKTRTKNAGSSGGEQQAAKGKKINGNGVKGGRSTLMCWFCKTLGHPFYKCHTAPPGWSPPGWEQQNRRRTNRRTSNSRSISPRNDDSPKRDNNGIKQQWAAGRYSKRTVTCIATVRSSQTTSPSAEGSLWLLDSGCSQHMTSDKRWFEDLKELDKPVQVELADGSTLNSSMVGTIRMTAPDGTTVRYTEVLYVPGLKSNLLSFCQLLKKKARINTNADGDTEITMLVGDEHIQIGLGKDVHGVLMVDYEPALAPAHESGHTHEDAPSNAHGHGGLNGQSAPASVAYRIAHMARVVKDMARNGDKDTHSPRTFNAMLADAETLLGHQQHTNEDSPHVAVWTSGGEGKQSAVGKGDSTDQDLHGADEDNATEGNGGAAANELPAADVTVSEEVEDDDTGSKVGYAITGVRMADLTYKETKFVVTDQPTLAKDGHDITCSRMCGLQPIPHGSTSAHGQQVNGAGATLTCADFSRCAGQQRVTQILAPHSCVCNHVQARIHTSERGSGVWERQALGWEA